tara:strand:+ start:2545 stop:3318 length:774 start_codon:yes stop_codon:yes gene_type:complete
MDQSITCIIDILISEKYLSSDSVKKIFSNQKIIDMIITPKAETSYNKKNCEARVWKNGFDNIQCNCLKKEGKYCITHSKRIQEKGNWWLGNILESRPEIPIYYDGTVHYWKKEVEEEKEKVHSEKEVKETKVDITPTKRKRGRPKGSKNKKKNEKNKDELTKEDILFLLKEKEKESINEEKVSLKSENKNEDDNSNKNTYIVDNVPYELDGINIMDPFDYSPIGIKGDYNQIIYEDEDAKERHEENIHKYKNHSFKE